MKSARRRVWATRCMPRGGPLASVAVRKGLLSRDAAALNPFLAQEPELHHLRQTHIAEQSRQ